MLRLFPCLLPALLLSGFLWGSAFAAEVTTALSPDASLPPYPVRSAQEIAATAITPKIDSTLKPAPKLLQELECRQSNIRSYFDTPLPLGLPENCYNGGVIQSNWDDRYQYSQEEVLAFDPTTVPYETIPDPNWKRYTLRVG